MQCPICGKISSIHINHPTEWGWHISHFCEDCRLEHAHKNERICPRCGRNLSDFYRTGFLGCYECYRTFAPELHPLLESYHGISHGVIRGVLPPGGDRLAKIRLSEFSENFGKLHERSARKNDAHRSEPKCQGVKPSGVSKNSTPVPLFDHPVAQQFDQIGKAGASSGALLRLRLARNIPGIVYPDLLSGDENRTIGEMLLQAGSTAAVHFQKLSWFDPESTCREGTSARWIFIGEEWMEECKRIGFFPKGALSGAIFYRSPHYLSFFYTADEDHLRVQWLWPISEGAEFSREILNGIEEEQKLIDSLFPWQYDPGFGFLTSCPSHAGYGIRFSMWISPQGLRAAGRWRTWEGELQSSGFEIRGEKGEKSDRSQSLQISRSFFDPEEEGGLRASLERVLGIFKRFYRSEKKARLIREKDRK